jgi:D-xylose transport system ATP-binding protein
VNKVVLESQNIIKDFPGVRALDHVSFTLLDKQIHALCGENGAGKSTLINVLSGYYPISTYEGRILIEGQEVQFKNIEDAIQTGIAVVHQELGLFHELSVAENIFMGSEIQKHGVINWDEMYQKTQQWIDLLRLDGVNARTKVGGLGVGQQQLVEIARVLAYSEIKVLILDEPTASLTKKETDVLFGIIRDIRNRGTACIYISHKIDEVMQLADYVTVIRDGKTIGGDETASLTSRKIISMMVGREIEEMYPQITRSVADEEVVLSVKDYDVLNRSTGKNIISNADFSLKRGEILGLYGLLGAGRTELVSSIYGLPIGKKKGEVCLYGKKVNIKSSADALSMGLTYVTEDRKLLGIIPTMNIRENGSLAFLKKFDTRIGINVEKEFLEVSKTAEQFRVKTPNMDVKIVNLSGGNQQKVLLVRNLLEKIKIIILDEPTRGIDVGAKQEIYQIISDLSDQGVSIIMVSSELPEILGMCDRILVMNSGAIAGEFDNSTRAISQDEILRIATGTE